MPPSFLAPLQSYRRSGASTSSARQRENRPQHATPNSSTRRRKSRSPDPMVEEVTMRNDPATIRKKKRPHLTPSSSSVNEIAVRPTYGEDMAIDRGRKAKVKPRVQSSFVVEGDVPVQREPVRGTGNGKSKRKDRSRSREASQRLSMKTASPEVDDVDPPHTAPFAIADLNHMKQEVEELRKQLTVSKKTIKKQSKVIDDLRKDLTNSAKTQKEQSKEMDKLKVQSKKSEELATSIEANLMCQICMEILAKPHGLSPCGHVLCQTCLQEWFRSTPPGEDDMYDDDLPQSLLYRKKTCPCCRAVVRSRPIPLFVVKSLASALEKAKITSGATPRASPPPLEGDPWAGIFLDRHLHDADDDWGADDDGDDGDEDVDEDDDDDGNEEDDDDWSFDGYGTPEDEERYEGSYVRARWAPPTVHVTPDDYPFIDDLDADDLAMLRRGVTLQMIDLFSMTYSHRSGLKAIVDDENAVYLGWNIFLHPEDEAGEEYMDWITADMYERPERWSILEDFRGSWTAWKLVPDADNEEYGTTDSEAWEADLASED
ncbi:hypothetical protein AcW2_005659 [Taiwanofungus camphoratus]|nr:hypothetical protein AcW2_005659 [Antrodia cinnamomea]